jgi:hypothetical protein
VERRPSAGHSYEFWNGFQKADFAGKPPAYSGRTSDGNGDGFPDCLKIPARLKRPARVILVLDGDDRYPSGAAELNNFPDYSRDNHGSHGWSMGFADGHSDWVTKRDTYRVLYQSDMTASHIPPEFRPK